MDGLTRGLARLLAKSWRGKKCGARTRTGRPCKMRPATPWGERCRLHGGLSTGPKSQEGRERIAEAQRQRWARWRAERGVTQDSGANASKSDD